MKKLIALLLSVACIVSNLCIPVLAANTSTNNNIIKVEKEFNNKYAKFKASADFHFDYATNKWICKKGYYRIDSIIMKAPYMNQWGGQGGLYKGTGSLAESSSYTHKEWQRDSLYDRGVGNACRQYSYAMGISALLGKVVSPTEYHKYLTRKDKYKGYGCYYAGSKNIDWLTGHIRQGHPVIFCVCGKNYCENMPNGPQTGNNRCPFTDGDHVILIYGIDENDNCLTLSPNDFFGTDGNCPSANINIDGKHIGRSTSYIEGYKNSRKWPWKTLKYYYHWHTYLVGPGSEAIMNDVEKWVDSMHTKLNKTYSISYNLNGGKVSGNPTKYTYGSKPFTLKNPTKNKYTFLGWTTPGNSTPRKNITVDPSKSNKNLTFNAKWTRAFTVKVETGKISDNISGEKEVVTVNPCKSHTWGTWKVTRKATCTHKGEKKRVCSKCNDVEIKEIPLAHSYKTINNLIKCSKCNDVLFNPAAKPLETELHQKNKYAFNDAQITTIAKLMVVNYKHNRDLMEASLSAALNCAESKGIKDTKKIANFLYNCFGGSNYIKKYNNSKDGVTNKDYLIVKYCITKGLRVFPGTIVAFDWKKDISSTKSVKVNGKTHKIVKNKYGEEYEVYKTVNDVVYGRKISTAVKKALTK